MVEKLKLGIDLDDTVWKYLEELIKYYNSKNGTHYNPMEFEDYSLLKSINLNETEAWNLLIDFEENYFCNETILLDGFLEIFERIRNKFEIYFITARPKITESTINEKVKLFGGNNIPVYYCREIPRENQIPKIEVCKDLGIDIMIDDGLYNLNDCSVNGIKCLMIDYPWNQTDELHENIVRVKNWVEIEEELNKILEKVRE